MNNIANPNEPSTPPTSKHESAFSIANLRLSQDFIGGMNVQQLLVTVPVRKPDKQWWVRTHPDPDFRLPVAVLELTDDRDVYVVTSGIAEMIPTEIRKVELITSINRQKVLFLWPVPIPGEDGRSNSWHTSAKIAAQTAQERWVRVVADMSLGSYQVGTAPRDFPDPVWPDYTFQQLIEIAFREHLITSLDHPALQKLRGER